MTTKTQDVLPQQLPTEGEGEPIWDQVVADMQARDRFGREKYYKPLMAFNGREPLVDAYQEALDLSVYLKQEIIERRRLTQRIRWLEQELVERDLRIAELEEEVQEHAELAGPQVALEG